ncbi:MAG: thioredoxin [Phycisphaerae bacterium]|nr:thioredoxin [Phycisphaerae bacterium]
MALEFTDDNFQSEVLDSEQPVLVDFWAEWCGPCKMLGPVIDELATEFEGKAKVGKVDIDNNRDAAVKYGIQSIPTVLILKNGEIENKFVGIASKDDLADAINAAM